MFEVEVVQRTLHDMSNVGMAFHMDRRHVEAEAEADPEHWRLRDQHLDSSVPAVRNTRTASVAVARGAGNPNRQVVLYW